MDHTIYLHNKRLVYIVLFLTNGVFSKCIDTTLSTEIKVKKEKHRQWSISNKKFRHLCNKVKIIDRLCNEKIIKYMLQILHQSSTMQIPKKIKIQFQELKEFRYGSPACIDNENN